MREQPPKGIILCDVGLCTGTLYYTHITYTSISHGQNIALIYLDTHRIHRNFHFNILKRCARVQHMRVDELVAVASVRIMRIRTPIHYYVQNNPCV